MTTLTEQNLRKPKRSREVVIDLDDVGKKYIVHHEKPTLAEDMSRRLRFQANEEYWALRHINLQVHRGERVGFYGRNGVGKTTLLKLIAGISAPTEGSIRTKGRIISLIGLEAGFHPDLTGQENIFLNGLVIGMSHSEIETKLAQIVDFAGINDFITAPLYTYSSGMKLRLGFSVAIHAEPEILLLDEVINMGDEEFQRKSQQRMTEMFDRELTVLMVSHQLEFLKTNSTRLIRLA